MDKKIKERKKSIMFNASMEKVSQVNRKSAENEDVKSYYQANLYSNV